MNPITIGFKDAERGGLNDPTGGEGQTPEKLGEEMGKAASKIAYAAVAPSNQELAQLVLPKLSDLV